MRFRNTLTYLLLFLGVENIAEKVYDIK